MKAKQAIYKEANRIKKRLARLYSTGISYTWKQYQTDLHLLECAVQNDIKRLNVIQARIRR